MYDINVIAWDYGLSPLHTAILNGHTHIIKLLVSEYGADALLPVKFVDPGTSNARGAIMTIILAMSLPTDKAKEVVALLLELGATATQADMHHVTAFHHVVALDNSDVLDILLANDRPATLSVLNNLGTTDRWGYAMDSPLSSCVKKGHEDMVAKLLSLKVKPEIAYDDWVKLYLAKNPHAKNTTKDQMLKTYHSTVAQPVISAAAKNMTNRWQVGEVLLDIIQKKLTVLHKYEVTSSAFWIRRITVETNNISVDWLRIHPSKRAFYSTRRRVVY